MNITFRHLAAIQFTIIAFFCVAFWFTLFYPFDEIGEQFKFFFANNFKHRQFFILFAWTTNISIVLAVSYWFIESSLRPFAYILLSAAIFLFIVAVWRFDFVFIFAYGYGLFCAAWVYFRPNAVIKWNSFDVK